MKTFKCKECGKEGTYNRQPKKYCDQSCRYKHKAKQHKEAFPNYLREDKLQRMYGISVEHYNEMYVQQDGRCGICGDRETKIDYRTGKIHNLSVDHDHKTGEVRGLLCGSCNKGLGLFKDSVEVLERAAEYLGKAI